MRKTSCSDSIEVRVSLYKLLAWATWLTLAILHATMLAIMSRVGAARMPPVSMASRALTLARHVHTGRSASFRVPWCCVGALSASVVAFFGFHASQLSLEAPMDRVVREQQSCMDMPVYMKTDGSNLNDTGSLMRLVGLGVRTVTFLRFYVYVAGLYVAEDALEAARSQTKGNQLDLEQKVRQWLEAGIPCAIRIMPTRSTDFSHLRDGLVRAINVRAKDARLPSASYELSDEAEGTLSKNLTELKSLFPRFKVQRGHTLDIIVQKTRLNTYLLSLQYNGKELGTVESAPASTSGTLPPFTLPTSLLLAYVGTHPDISEPLRKSIASGLEDGLP